MRSLYHLNSDASPLLLKFLIDPIFQTTQGYISLTTQESSSLISIYSCFLESLVANKFVNIPIESNFHSKALDYLKSSKSKYTIKKLPTYNEIRINPIGYYSIFGVNIDRKTNKYINDYDMVRKGKDLFFSERIKTQQDDVKTSTKGEILGKELVKEYMDSKKTLDLDTPKSSPNIIILSYNIKETLRKLLPSQKPKPVKVLKPAEIWKKVASSSFTQVVASSSEDYIIVEDFQIISHLGLDVLDMNSKVLKEEKPDKEFGGFCHYIRTERQVFGKVAPSIETMKTRKLIDFDGFMRGNPPCLIKRFDLC